MQLRSSPVQAKTTGEYFSEEHRHLVAEVVSPHAPIRAARLLDPPDVDFELAKEVGIAVHLNDGFALTRRIGSRSDASVGRFGEVCIYAPGNRILAAVHGECRLVQMALPVGVILDKLAEDHGLVPDRGWIRSLRVEHHRELTRLICLGLCEPDAGEEVMSNVVSCLAALWSDAGVAPLRSGLAPARLRRVRDYVEADLSRVTLRGMATEAALSPYHFSREFRREAGTAPWEYVVLRRLARATELLAVTDLGIDAVARLAGFTHASHLQRHFRARLGATAGAVRRSLLP